MNRLRVVDPDAFDRSKYATQRLWFGESCAIIGSLVPAGKPAYRHDPGAFVESARFPGFSLNRSVLPNGHSDAISLYVGVALDLSGEDID